MKQVILIRGGTPKETYKDFYDFVNKYKYDPYETKFKKWSDVLSYKIDSSFEVLNYERINKKFADYQAWKIMFKKMIPYFKDELLFVGHSLGGSFILKYFSEENIDVFKNKILKIFLVAPAIDSTKFEQIGTFKVNLDELKQKFKDLQKKLVVFASVDDDIVPIEQIYKLKEILFGAEYKIYKDKGHFLLENFDDLFEYINKFS